VAAFFFESIAMLLAVLPNENGPALLHSMAGPTGFRKPSPGDSGRHGTRRLRRTWRTWRKSNGGPTRGPRPLGKCARHGPCIATVSPGHFVAGGMDFRQHVWLLHLHLLEAISLLQSCQY
jgi:hypothetical protein